MAADRGSDSESRRHRKSESQSQGSVNGDEIEEPDFSDPEGYVDDISEEELLGDLLRSKPKESDGIDNIVVVDNVPQVGPDRQDKLKNVIRKIFEKFGKINREFFPVTNEKCRNINYLICIIIIVQE
uniref:Uncharacterized protein n=1 Tax=Magallana gigas TaxID=29159 RepID=A0A8W8I091_MAGGI